MRPSDVLKAEKEAQRFLDTVHEFYAASANSDSTQKILAGRKLVKAYAADHGCFVCGEGSKYTSAMRRASMDLTRALADLRGKNR